MTTTWRTGRSLSRSTSRRTNWTTTWRTRWSSDRSTSRSSAHGRASLGIWLGALAEATRAALHGVILRVILGPRQRMRVPHGDQAYSGGNMARSPSTWGNDHTMLPSNRLRSTVPTTSSTLRSAWNSLHLSKRGLKHGKSEGKQAYGRHYLSHVWFQSRQRGYSSTTTTTTTQIRCTMGRSGKYDRQVVF